MNSYDWKYIFKRVLVFFIIFIIMSFISSCDVHAETFDITSNTTIAGYNLPAYWNVSTGGRNLLVKYQDYQYYSQEPFYSNFGYFSICANGDFEVNNSNADCSDGCYQNLNVASLGGNCTIYLDNGTTSTGFNYYLFYSVKTWGWVNAQTLPIVYDTLTFKSKVGYNVNIQFSYNFLSNEDMYVNYASNNRLQELQQLTNQIIQQGNQAIINNQNNNTSTITNSINSATQSAIDNANQNTQDIIDNQNTNSQKEIESQQVCKYIDKSNILNDNNYLYNNGSYSTTNNNYGVTDYIKIIKSDIKVITDFPYNNDSSTCFYNTNKTLISCILNKNMVLNENLTIPIGSEYIRVSIRKDVNKPQLEICSNGNQAMNDSINNLNDNINDDNVSGAESQVNDLLNNSAFQDNSGIQSIITAPLNFIQGLTNTCSPLSLTIPFIDTNVTIPCMKQELTNRVPTVVPILSTIINGFIIYRILLDIVAIVKSAREPDEDRIEVLDL